MEQVEYNNLIETLKEQVEAEDVNAMRMLGDMYYQGISGNDENLSDALPYWQLAANCGDAVCACKVGLCLLKGNNEIQGFQYLLKSASTGYADAQYWVGLCYLDGLGTEKNHSAGISFLRKAALNNQANAQLALAQTIMQDKRDALEAIHWMCCAHLNGNKEATAKLQEFIGSMDGADIFVQHRLEYIQKYGITPPGPNGTPSSSNPSDTEGCYIATAVYGSYEAPEVMVLRGFRDEVLRKHWWGKLFIKVYYCISPPMARKLKDMNKLNQIIRQMLDQIVVFLCKNVK